MTAHRVASALLIAGWCAFVGPRAAWSADVRGSWQTNIDCGLFATATSFLDITGPAGGPLSASAPACGTLQVPGEIHEITSCSQGTEAVDVSGSSFALPPTGVVHSESSTDVPFTFPVYLCPAALVINESRYVGTIDDDGAGTATRIHGTLFNYLLQVYEPDNSLCVDIPDTVDCQFDMRRNDVPAGSNVSVSPRAGATVTFEAVTAPGTTAVVPLTTPSASVPGNFNVLASSGVPIYYDVHTSAAHSGAITTCFAYPDADGDGLIDGSGDAESELRLLHDEGGTFVDRTVSLDPIGNVICGETSSLSQLTLGVGTGTAAFACAPSPSSGCKQSLDPRKARLQIKDLPGDEADQLKWKWMKGEAVAFSELGTPTTAGGDAYALCLYDESGPAPALVFAALIPANGDCGDNSCWKVTGKSLRYKQADGAPHGVTKLRVGSGGDRKAKVILKAQGVHLGDGPLGAPPVPPPLPLRVQLQAENGTCWESVFTSAGVKKNSGGQFIGKGG